MRLSDFAPSDLFSEAEKAALRLSDAMSATPAIVSGEVAADVVVHYGEEGLVALASIIAREHFRSRFNRALGIGSDELSEGAFCPLPLQ